MYLNRQLRHACYLAWYAADRIKTLMDGSVGMCDQVAPYALINFQMGIWEEQIIHGSTECLHLLDSSISEEIYCILYPVGAGGRSTLRWMI